MAKSPTTLSTCIALTAASVCGVAARADRDASLSVELFDGTAVVEPVAGWRANCTGLRSGLPVTAGIIMSP